MKLIEFLSKSCVVAGAVLKDKANAIRAVAETAIKNPVLKDIAADSIIEALDKREQLGSTGFGNSIAIPHCRLEGVNSFVVGAITVPAGVDFESLDGKAVKLIVFIVAPAGESNEHIRVLSAISQTLLIPGLVNELVAGRTDEAVYESFLRHSRADINGKAAEDKNLIHVFVQDENIFRDILGALAGIGTSSMVVLNAENTGLYLSKLPLFAGFWTDQASGFSRIIVAVVEKALTNETIRRIESITGNLNDHKGLLITVQQLSYWAGSLETKA